MHVKGLQSNEKSIEQTVLIVGLVIFVHVFTMRVDEIFCYTKLYFGQEISRIF